MVGCHADGSLAWLCMPPVWVCHCFPLHPLHALNFGRMVTSPGCLWIPYAKGARVHCHGIILHCSEGPGWACPSRAGSFVYVVFPFSYCIVLHPLPDFFCKVSLWSTLRRHAVVQDPACVGLFSGVVG